MIVLDRSSSMLARDFPGPDAEPLSRIEAARRTLVQFVARRPDDLIGLVAFANYPDLACPPTLDHAFLVDVARSIEPSADPGEDGTNIGDALVWALDALRATAPKQKVVVLLTDGENRPQGVVPSPADPLEAARLAGELGVTLHTIAVGRTSPRNRTEPLTGLGLPSLPLQPDFSILDDMARLAGGQSFAAWSVDRLEEVYQAIDALERSPVEGTIHTRYREHHAPWLAAAALALALDRLLSSGRFRRLP
jgi:Ca-activated chloride channel family protein